MGKVKEMVCSDTSTLFARARAWLKMEGLESSREKTGLSPALVVHVMVAGPPLVQLVGVLMDNADTKGTRTESKLTSIYVSNSGFFEQLTTNLRL